MHDLKTIRENKEAIKRGLLNKGVSPEVIDTLLALDEDRRQLITEVEQIKAKRNEANSEIAKAKREGTLTDAKLSEMKAISQKIADFDIKVGEIDEKMASLMIAIPNIPHSSVPIGKTGADNQIVRTWGTPAEFPFEPKDHLQLAEKNKWVSFERAAQMSGSGFALYQGQGARLVRALLNFMIDLHTREHGYQEMWPPLLVNPQAMTGTGQLPKMEEDMYGLKEDGYYLIPTAEVPLTNIHRQEVLKEEELPVQYTAYTPCFRREAGSYGKDTKGLSRLHQFDKVELVKLVQPNRSLDELESLVANAERVLQLLELPYRVVLLCTGDLSFAAAKCYDLEVYAPGTKKWFEVSSCSTFMDFQARRIGLKYKPSDGGKPQWLHTLNGSGVAFARTILCLMEHHQQKDGSIRIPAALERYMSEK